MARDEKWSICWDCSNNCGPYCDANSSNWGTDFLDECDDYDDEDCNDGPYEGDYDDDDCGCDEADCDDDY